MLAKRLQPEDYEIDIKSRHVVLTEKVWKKLKDFGIQNLYDVQYVNLLHHINNALRATYIMQKDIDYVVQDGKLLLLTNLQGV